MNKFGWSNSNCLTCQAHACETDKYLKKVIPVKLTNYACQTDKIIPVKLTDYICQTDKYLPVHALK